MRTKAEHERPDISWFTMEELAKELLGRHKAALFVFATFDNKAGVYGTGNCFEQLGMATYAYDSIRAELASDEAAGGPKAE